MATSKSKGRKKWLCVLGSRMSTKIYWTVWMKMYASWGSNEVMEIVMARLQRFKPRRWNNGWQAQTCDGLEHASEHGMEATKLVKGKDEQGSWLVWRKEEDNNLGGKLSKQQGWRSKADRDSWRGEKTPFWALFLNESSNNLNYTSHQAVKAIFHFDDPFPPILLLRDPSGCLLRDASRALEHIS